MGPTSEGSPSTTDHFGQLPVLGEHPQRLEADETVLRRDVFFSLDPDPSLTSVTCPFSRDRQNVDTHTMSEYSVCGRPDIFLMCDGPDNQKCPAYRRALLPELQVGRWSAASERVRTDLRPASPERLMEHSRPCCISLQISG